MRARGRRSVYGAAAGEHGLRRCGDIDRQRAQGAGTPPDAQVKRAAAREQAAVERSPGCQPAATAAGPRSLLIACARR